MNIIPPGIPLYPSIPLPPLRANPLYPQPICNDSAVCIQNSSSQSFLLRKRNSRWDDNPRVYLKPGSKLGKWGSSNEKTFTPLPFPSIPNRMSIDDFETLIRKSRLEEVTKRLSVNNWEQSDSLLRSPSPEPVYDSKKHIRLNTFDNRMKEVYLREKNSLIEDVVALDKTFNPPLDWQPPKKVEKLYYSNKPECNLTALILGPEGRTQKELEKKTGCRISIRGAGSNWNSTFDKVDPNEPIHVYLQADTLETLKKGHDLIAPILDTKSIEHLNFRNMQKQISDSQFGLRVAEGKLGCENCGMTTHSTWACDLK